MTTSTKRVTYLENKVWFDKYEKCYFIHKKICGYRYDKTVTVVIDGEKKTYIKHVVCERPSNYKNSLGVSCCGLHRNNKN